jgi:hypothetical protein
MDKRPPQIFVLIDALGWQVLKGRGFLNDILTYRKPLRTVLGFSSGAIPTMLTGRAPSETGHWNLYYYDPSGSPFWWLKFFRFLPDSLLDNRVSRKLIKELGRRVLGMGPLFECCVSPRWLPFFNWVEKRNIYAAGGISGAPSIFDDLAAQKIPNKVYTYHEAGDQEILRAARFDIEVGEAGFFFLYLSELDAVLHFHPTGGPELESRIQWYEKELLHLFTIARQVHPDATMTVLSDHGMAPVTERFDLVQEVESLGFRQGKDYLSVYDSTMARFWFFTDAAREGIRERMAKLSCARILTDGELQDLGIFFSDRRYGELIVLLNPGWLVAKSDFNGAGWNPLGMHGYHPDDPFSDAIYLSNRQPPVPVHAISDVYQCMQKAIQ